MKKQQFIDEYLDKLDYAREEVEKRVKLYKEICDNYYELSNEIESPYDLVKKHLGYIQNSLNSKFAILGDFIPVNTLALSKYMLGNYNETEVYDSLVAVYDYIIRTYNSLTNAEGETENQNFDKNIILQVVNCFMLKNEIDEYFNMKFPRIENFTKEYIINVNNGIFIVNEDNIANTVKVRYRRS